VQSIAAHPPARLGFLNDDTGSQTMDYEQMFVTAAIAASVAFATPPAKAQASHDGLEARVRAVAQEGPDALRRFVWRTRMIHSLNFADYALAEWDEPTLDATDGFWAGVPGDDTGVWIEAASYLPEADAGDSARD